VCATRVSGEIVPTNKRGAECPAVASTYRPDSHPSSNCSRGRTYKTIKPATSGTLASLPTGTGRVIAKTVWFKRNTLTLKRYNQGMGNTSQRPAIDTHPQREKIIQALLDNEPPKKIAKWVNPPISHVSIWRYRSTRLKPVLKRAVNTAKLLQSANVPLSDGKPTAEGVKAIELAKDALVDDPLLSRVTAKYERYDRWYSQAEETKDFGALASIDRAETTALSFHAELTGRLQGATSGTLVQIVIGVLGENAEQKRENMRDTEGVTDVVVDIMPSRD
jgi:hypothetical protein